MTARIRRRVFVPGLLAAVAAVSLPAVTPGATAEAASRPAPAASPSSPAPSGPLDTLTGLAAQRLLVNDRVAASKSHSHAPVDDPAREQQELASVRQRASAVGLSADVAETFFKDQFTAGKQVQDADLAAWRAHPERVPAGRPDLRALRGRLDRLSAGLLRALASAQPLRSAPARCGARLAQARHAVNAAYRLDIVHRRALQRATRSVCAPR